MFGNNNLTADPFVSERENILTTQNSLALDGEIILDSSKGSGVDGEDALASPKGFGGNEENPFASPEEVESGGLPIPNGLGSATTGSDIMKESVADTFDATEPQVDPSQQKHLLTEMELAQINKQDPMLPQSPTSPPEEPEMFSTDVNGTSSDSEADSCTPNQRGKKRKAIEVSAEQIEPTEGTGTKKRPKLNAIGTTAQLNQALAESQTVTGHLTLAESHTETKIPDQTAEAQIPYPIFQATPINPEEVRKAISLSERKTEPDWDSKVKEFTNQFRLLLDKSRQIKHEEAKASKQEMDMNWMFTIISNHFKFLEEYRSLLKSLLRFLDQFYDKDLSEKFNKVLFCKLFTLIDGIEYFEKTTAKIFLTQEPAKSLLTQEFLQKRLELDLHFRNLLACLQLVSNNEFVKWYRHKQGSIHNIDRMKRYEENQSISLRAQTEDKEHVSSFMRP